MRRRPELLLTLVLAAALAGCATAPAAAPPATATTTSAPAPAPGSVRLTGDLRTPTTLDAQALAAMPQTQVSVSFQSAKGTESHTESGVPLAVILPAAALATDPSRKNDQLAFGVEAIGADGYRALVSFGEVSPDFGNRGVLVATGEDGRPLPRPRLVVPGDVKGGRYVSDLVELHVGRVP